jgi:peptide/nickel transport system ATP-binding protein
MKPGESVALVGRSGCGKSTLARAILALDRPTSGKVELDGVDIANMTDDGIDAAPAQDAGGVSGSLRLVRPAP